MPISMDSRYGVDFNINLGASGQERFPWGRKLKKMGKLRSDGIVATESAWSWADESTQKKREEERTLIFANQH